MPEPQSVQVELAEGVAAFLNTKRFSLEFQANREWGFRVDPEDLEKVTVCVVPGTKTVRSVSRGTKLNELVIDVSVRRRHGGGPDDMPPKERCDAIAAFCQEIEDCLIDPNAKIVTANLKATPLDEELLFVADDLFSERTMTLIVSVRYSLFR